MLATVLYDHHFEADDAVSKCPTHCIRNFESGYPDGSSFASPTVPFKPTKAA
jgi:electron transport complex protein RnfB